NVEAILGYVDADENSESFIHDPSLQMRARAQGGAVSFPTSQNTPASKRTAPPCIFDLPVGFVPARFEAEVSPVPPWVS
ncbi:hypothetical protein, partial [Bosea psychrotolerans]|uniref:hypothetical protein n=1 Tax=Bosea psychrotolerans TaxID=1871628 RepID=UPI001AECF699